MKKLLLPLCGLALLCSCASNRETSQIDTAQERHEAALEAMIGARAAEFQKRGHSYRDARAMAESEYAGLSALRKAGPSARASAGIPQ
jgi:hypothetical protein